MIHAPSYICDKLVGIFREGWKKGKDNDELVLSPGGRIQERRFKGYDTYRSTHGNNSDPNLEKNMRECTTTIGSFINVNDDIAWVCKYYSAFRYLKNMAEKETDMTVAIVDILRQSSKNTSGRREALFRYHIDSKEERKNVQVSVIFMITHTQSAMQMGPDDHPHKYTNIKNVVMA